ncbi:MAG: sulfotransferase family protein [Alphaproteobacteria bacterium]|nr:sulfotransferase family protein [Alphaproteobacteria bacterium]
MKVIGAGFGRTGTESTKAALERLLDGKCYHMTEIIGNRDHLRRWVEFGRSGRTVMDWKTLLQGYEASLDWPICNYYKELMEIFPDAKVMLTYRDPQKWFDSYQILVRLMRVTSWLSILVPFFRRLNAMIENTAWHIFQDRRDRAQCVEVYNRHVAEVKAVVPADRLLVFQVQDGWEPLCKFLNVPVPDNPFPHLNSREDFKRAARKIISRAVLKSVSIAVLVAAVAAAAAYLIMLGVAGR